MVWCTYCGQEFSRAEHLDRHVLTHINIKPFKCSTCHFSFKRRDLLTRHYILVHKDLDGMDGDSSGSSRRPIACTSCAKAKAKCDKAVPTCGRCLAKGLVCEARTTKRSNGLAFRQARRQLNLFRRPVTIAPDTRATSVSRTADAEEPLAASNVHSTYSTPQQRPTRPANIHYSSPPPSFTTFSAVTTPEQAISTPELSASFSSPESLHGYPMNYRRTDFGSVSMAPFDGSMYYQAAYGSHIPGMTTPQYGCDTTYSYSVASSTYAPVTSNASMWCNEYENAYENPGAAGQSLQMQSFSDQATAVPVSEAYRSGTLYSPTPSRPSTAYPISTALEEFTQYYPAPH